MRTSPGPGRSCAWARTTACDRAASSSLLGAARAMPANSPRNYNHAGGADSHSGDLASCCAGRAAALWSRGNLAPGRSDAAAKSGKRIPVICDIARLVSDHGTGPAPGRNRHLRSKCIEIAAQICPVSFFHSGGREPARPPGSGSKRVLENASSGGPASGPEYQACRLDSQRGCMYVLFISTGCPWGLRGECRPVEPDPDHAGGGI
jgi:hypothetical protein